MTIKILTLMLSILLLNILNPQNANAQCHIDDWMALKALYESTNGDFWTNRAGWGTILGNSPPENCNLENLYGVHLNAMGRVVCLDFDGEDNCTYNYNVDGNNLNGIIPSSICNLSKLQHLEMNDNKLTGNIPPELGDLISLERLSLSNNQLSGSIPKDLGNLSNLTYLYLHSNQLSGNIPNELGNLGNLGYLAFYSNQLSGSIPSELGNLSNLIQLQLNNNQLNGNIPSELGNLSSLTILYLHYNELQNIIPPELGNLSSLQYLYLSYNQLSGSIPKELGNLSNLNSLSLNFNYLSGSIPPELGSLSNLAVLNLWKNQLTGSIPLELGNLSNLTSMWLTSNKLTGSFLLELGNLSFLTMLGINDNLLIGCYDDNLTVFCDQLIHSYLGPNAHISDGNNFDATWEDFCTSGAGACNPCPPDCPSGLTDVYPGDLNHDGIVNNQDVSLSGLFQYQSGYPRPSEHQNINWYPHPSQNWGILNNQNNDLKHHDCNGDGIIDEDDQQAVEINMGQIWSEPDPIPPPTESDYQVMLQPIDQIFDGYLVMNVALERRSGGDLNVQSGYFTIDYSDVEGEFTEATLNLLPTSWLGILDLNLWFEKTPFPNEQKIEVGFTKTDNTNSTGSGVIGQLTLAFDNGTSKKEATNVSYEFKVNTIGIHNSNTQFTPIENQLLEVIINPNACLTNLNIQEDTPFQNLYQSSNNITTNGFILIGEEQVVEYNAKRVRINSGFSIKAGANFKVRNSGCN